jgi:hypothetical protein
MKIFVLKTGIFAEDAVLQQALACLESDNHAEQFDATRPGLEDADWDTAVKNLIAADRVIAI